ncbi:acylneuraminate cytidylyltransferase family protein [Clostridium sp. Marseille-P2415]|uniref:acylneuraminate cytidylyltransferase family protein n=1 Tax=Clostridium sp. Marseille-P2415 TaxID=1805471 RepID=UPI001F3F9EE7|nr:acylneuraminate cytidylyltransferase family protein [Clostridium sp. Marseille-P2415]
MILIGTVMYKNKTFLGIIPARSGSKGIPDKNIREINHKPLMAYTIEAGKKSGLFDQLLVSTDSENYAEIAKQYGASVPFLRPKELASDQAATKDVILHAIKELSEQGKTFDYFMVLQPTSPLRNETHILESADLLLKKNGDAVIGVCRTEPVSHLAVPLTETGEIKAGFPDKRPARRQDFPPEYRINGALYLVSANIFLKYGSFYAGRTLPYFMNAIDSIDIDDEFQLKIAELLLMDQASPTCR